MTLRTRESSWNLLAAFATATRTGPRMAML
jgi:hypothetical protein